MADRTEATPPPPVDDDDAERPARPQSPSLEGLAIAGITRRRAAWVVGFLVSSWIVIVFARQVGEASGRAADVDRARQANTTLAADVASLQRELVLIQKQSWIEQQARRYGLGMDKDRPFALAPDAPPLSAEAPGSASVRLGAPPKPLSPLESWLSALFGPSS
jgi:hypothetical protein